MWSNLHGFKFCEQIGIYICNFLSFLLRIVIIVADLLDLAVFMQHTSTVDVDVVITSTLHRSGRSMKRHNYRSVNEDGFFAFDHSGMADTHIVGDHDKIDVFVDGEELQVHEVLNGETLSEGITTELC